MCCARGVSAHALWSLGPNHTSRDCVCNCSGCMVVAVAVVVRLCWRRSLELLELMPVQSYCPGYEDVFFEEL